MNAAKNSNIIEGNNNKYKCSLKVINDKLNIEIKLKKEGELIYLLKI